MAFDEGQVHYSYQNVQQEDAQNEDIRSRKRAKYVFREFVRNFYLTGEREKDKSLYRQQLMEQMTHMNINLAHMKAHDPDLGCDVEEKAAQIIPLLEEAAVDEYVYELGAQPAGESNRNNNFDPVSEGIQVMLYSSEPFGPASIRELSSDCVSRLVQIPGIITAASKPRHKATTLHAQCKDCKAAITLPCKPGMSSVMLPRSCANNIGNGIQTSCGQDPYILVADKCKFVDQQILKLQERPEDVPTGELPRTVTLVVDRLLVSKVAPGTRVVVTGIYSTWKADKQKGAVALQMPYIRVVGLRSDDAAKGSMTYTPEEVSEFTAFARQPGVHDKISDMMAPGIVGNQYGNIKSAIAVLLFGGARKQLPDGTWRRGDINVLLLGDPSTAKSQFLKFAAAVAPIAVYTSGKGSSAAGLTASVVQDANREFYLEGGTMVLADGGVCCIDEFDKMRPEDRVAIHEAMEQQTISIAKAGITTMLNSRTSVLAAANPPSGSYDDLKSASDNIDLQSTILSRFDLIFIVRDLRTVENDAQIARHVLSLHARGAGSSQNVRADKEKNFLKRYIKYCRDHCFPRLDEVAAKKLENSYVEMRQEALHAAQKDNSDMPPVPITVRQLEAMVRIAEAFARMELEVNVTESHVEKAVALFKRSTMEAVKAGLTDGIANAAVAVDSDTRRELEMIQNQVKLLISVFQTRSERSLVEQLVGMGYAENAVRRGLVFMIKEEVLEYKRERKLLRRVK